VRRNICVALSVEENGWLFSDGADTDYKIQVYVDCEFKFVFQCMHDKFAVMITA